MLAAFHAYPIKVPFAIDVIDIDADAALVDRYDERVPVLTGRYDAGQEIELCHYYLDFDNLHDFVMASRDASGGAGAPTDAAPIPLVARD